MKFKIYLITLLSSYLFLTGCSSVCGSCGYYSYNDYSSVCGLNSCTYNCLEEYYNPCLNNNCDI